ncbi:hypothetical protein EDC94DRAFT_580398 [Helicostylum pulchrum]|nr:hypothetical protein EDC94DRAFT_580398 [Helicostylum pulchrum]
MPALVNVREMYYLGENLIVYNGDSDLWYKSFKISGECIMFIVFEVWKLWLAFDGVLYTNSRTIWASASFSVFSFGFSILMIIESTKWIKSDEQVTKMEALPDGLEPLKYTNLYLLIVLSCIAFLIIPVTFYSAIKVAKDYGWDVYKKIGSSIKIQEMYITVQWFSLVLKIDMYFEFCAYALFLIYLATDFDYESDFYTVFSIVLVMLIFTIPSLVFSRYAISRESKTMMVSFIVFQVISIACMGFIMAMTTEMLVDWYAFTGFCLAFLLAAVGTIVLAVMCLLNFNKGLKEFVQWGLFTSKTPRRKSAVYNSMNQVDTFYGLEARHADGPIDDE